MLLAAARGICGFTARSATGCTTRRRPGNLRRQPYSTRYGAAARGGCLLTPEQCRQESSAGHHLNKWPRAVHRNTGTIPSSQAVAARKFTRLRRRRCRFRQRPVKGLSSTTWPHSKLSRRQCFAGRGFRFRALTRGMWRRPAGRSVNRICRSGAHWQAAQSRSSRRRCRALTSAAARGCLWSTWVWRSRSRFPRTAHGQFQSSQAPNRRRVRNRGWMVIGRFSAPSAPACQAVSPQPGWRPPNKYPLQPLTPDLRRPGTLPGRRL